LECSLLVIVTGVWASCQSIAPLPPVDLAAPGWHVQQGQALWTPAKGRPELAGELLAATNASGDWFVQFTKTPFTLATAQLAKNNWRVELGNGDYRGSGRGRPPERILWFQLARALEGADLGRDWRFERVGTNAWRLENRRAGERLEGTFFP
jgi:hypothetical protein